MNQNPAGKNVLDISQIIVNIQGTTTGITIGTDNGRRFWGKITICVEDGKISYIERHETIK